ncbi:MAG: V-type ATPase subunit [Faecalimonas umbilicata]|uniref:V-type ATPase subunit n=1 Tax=Faecalimonas umbilicata TaxID=1912855 RepID=UPI0039929C82
MLQISIEKLIISRTTDQPRKSERHRVLRTAEKLKDSQSVTLFDYDLALNLYYFTAMWKERKKFLKKKNWSFSPETAAPIDLLNMQWIYRAKKHFNLKEADIYSF